MDRVIRILKIEQITVYILYSAISIANIYYLLTKILKLNNKSFHLMMFILLQMSYFMIISSEIVFNFFIESADKLHKD